MNTDRRLAVLVAGADSLFRLGATALLAAEPGIQIAGETADGRVALELARLRQPDVLLLDIDIRGISALEVLSRLGGLGGQAKTVLAVADLDRSTLYAVVLRGARGILRKDLSAALIGKCVRHVAAGEFWLGRDLVGDLVDAISRERSGADRALTPREYDIVTSLVRGASNKDIAMTLGLTEQSVKNRLRRLFTRLAVSNRIELARHAVSCGLVARSVPGPVSDRRDAEAARGASAIR